MTEDRPFKTEQETNPQAVSSPANEQTLIDLRKWAFEKALGVMKRDSTDDAHEFICRAAEIEDYILSGRSPRQDFFMCVECALREVDHQQMPHISDGRKRAVLERVQSELITYKALDRAILR